MSEHEFFQNLTPLEKEPRVKEFGALDTETQGNEAKYIDGGVYVRGKFYRFSSAEKLLDFISSPTYKSFSFFAHNSTYDVGVLYKYIRSNHTILFLSGRVYLAKIYPKKSRRVYIADSLRLAANLPLSELGKSINLPKLPTPSYLLPEVTGKEKWTCDKHGKSECLECYLSRDCEIVYNYIDLFQKEINRLGGEMKYTLASTAMDLFRRAYLKDEYRTPFQARNDFARAAYFGGRVEPFKLGHLKNINIYDVNSLYPYVMKNFQYPNPNTLHGPLEDMPLEIIMEKEGISQVSIEVPFSQIPPLPFKWNHKLYFPQGNIRSYWTHAEIRKAISLGAKVHHVHKTLYSDTTCSPFISYVDDLYALRLAAKANNDPRQLVYKILLNSLYGKFGQRMQAGLEKLIPMQDYFESEDKSGYDFVEYDGMIYGRKAIPIFKQPVYINVLWAAYITAYARLVLYDFMMLFPDKIAYCDTDSLFTQEKLPLSLDLGAMKLEHENVEVDIIGPKTYLIYDGSNIPTAKAKGVPKRYQLEYIGTGEAHYLKSLGFFEANRRHLSPAQWVEMSKGNQETSPKRFYFDPHPANSSERLSRPFSFAEVLRLKD